MPHINNGKIKTQSDGNHTWKLQEVYLDTLGNTWYQLIDSDTLPAKRHTALSVKQSYLEIGIDKFTLDSAINTTLQLCEIGDTKNIEKLWDYIRDYMSFDFNSRNILEMSTILYTINEEEIYQFSEFYDNKKLEAFDKDGDCKSFFLTLSFGIATRLSEKYKNFSMEELNNLLLKEKLLDKIYSSFKAKIS